MSTNLDPNDKIILHLAAKAGESKLHLDPTDSGDVVELFSRLAPGDAVSGKFKATLDDAGEKVVTLSITEIELDPPTDDEPQTDDDEAGEGEASAAVTMMQNSEEKDEV